GTPEHGRNRVRRDRTRSTAVWSWLSIGGGDRDGADDRRPRPLDLLAPHDRQPDRPQLAVQRLGPGARPGAAADRIDPRDRPARDPGCIPPAPEVDRPGGGAGGGASDRHPALRPALVL